MSSPGEGGDGQSPGNKPAHSRFIELSVNKPELKAIFRRLVEREGGDEQARGAVGRILEDFYERMSRDILIGYFFDGRDLKVIAEKQQEFLLRAMGALESYRGKPPAQAHEELPKILRGHFDRRLVILEETLRDHGVPPQDIQTWLGFEDAFRDAVVRDE